MNLTHINADNFLGARSVALTLEQPVTLVCGANGAGKSSLRDAISLALTGDLSRIAKKGEAASLISEGASAASIEIGTADGDFRVAISKAGKISRDANAEPHPALPFVLDPAKFAELTDTERRAMLFGLLGIETSHKAIAERMERRGLDADKIAASLPILRAGFAAGEKHAKEQASQARGAWKAVAGETYGDKKAEDWAPAAVTVEGDPVKKAEHALEQAELVGGEISEVQQQIGASRAARQAHADALARMERLREQSGMVDRIRDRLKTAEENVENCRQQLAGAGSDDPKAPGSYLLRGLASVTAEFVEAFSDETGHEGLLTRAGAHLAEYRKLHGDPGAEPADPSRAAEIRKALQTAENGAANARRDLAAAEAAAAELAELEKSPPAAPAGTGDIEEQLRTLQQRRDDWHADARKYCDLAGAAERREKQIADAARHHADVQQWSGIADALSPDGIQAEMIAEALDPLNKRLAAHAALAEWPAVRIGADMGITFGGRPHSLCSESEQWRANAMMVITVAQVSGLRFAVLDRMDMLDATGREDILYWLSDLAEGKHIDSVIVIATLKAAPPAEALPAHISAAWIEGGRIEQYQRAKEAA